MFKKTSNTWTNDVIQQVLMGFAHSRTFELNLKLTMINWIEACVNYNANYDIPYLAEIQQLVKQYNEKLTTLESEKYDLEYQASKRDFMIKDLNQKVYHRPGK